MKLLCYISKRYKTNIYLIASESSNEVVIIDPLYFDENIFQFIEQNGYIVSGILVTRKNEKRINGIRTILQIYEADVIASSFNKSFGNIRNMSDGNYGSIAGVEFRILEADSYIFFRIGPYVFTGNGFSSGKHCTAHVRQVISTLDDDCLIFPTSGPPTTLSAERSWNPQFQVYLPDCDKAVSQ